MVRESRRSPHPRLARVSPIASGPPGTGRSVPLFVTRTPVGLLSSCALPAVKVGDANPSTRPPSGSHANCPRAPGSYHSTCKPPNEWLTALSFLQPARGTMHRVRLIQYRFAYFRPDKDGILGQSRCRTHHSTKWSTQVQTPTRHHYSLTRATTTSMTLLRCCPSRTVEHNDHEYPFDDCPIGLNA